MNEIVTRLKTIAHNTFRDAIRQKFFNFLLVLSVGLIVSSNFFRQFDFGSNELKFITDFGLGALFIFGSILSIVATAQLFFSEIENRTALTLLAKPVARWEFIVGKFLGIFALLVVFTALMTGILAAMLYWRESALIQRYPSAFEEGRLIHYSGLFFFGFLQLLKLGMLSAVTLFVSSFSNTNLYSVIISFFVMIICQLQYIARDHWAHISIDFLKYLALSFSLIFPNFQLFNVGDVLLFNHSPLLTWGEGFRIVLYGIIYILFFNGLTVLSFRNREI